MPGYARTYYPGTPTAGEAQFVTVGPSDDLAGIDIALTRTRTARIAGRIIDAAGQPSTGGNVSLWPSTRSTVTSVASGARISNGAFEFPNVPPGQYIIRADRGRKNASTEDEFGVLPVIVSGSDLLDLTVQTSTGSSIAGRIVFDTFDRAKTPSPGSIELSPMPVDFDVAPASVAVAHVREDWAFEMNGINGPRRLQLLRAPAEWTLKEIRVNGIDVTDQPVIFGRRDQSLDGVEVVLTDRINQVIGTVADDRGEPAPGTTVVCFSADRDRWYPSSRYLRRAVAGADGRFTMTGVPTGTYYVSVVHLSDDDDDAWQDSGVLESLMPRATTVTLGVGQTQTMRLRVP